MGRQMGATAAALLIGVGMGGFVDGIVFHQIVQWHNMLSNVLPPTTMAAMKVNMLWDGLFHAVTWLVTLVGILLLWRVGGRRSLPSPHTFGGLMIFGWGLFNLIEGVIDHHLLEIHHVREGSDYLVYDYAFLGVGGVGFIAFGSWLIQRGRQRERGLQGMFRDR